MKPRDLGIKIQEAKKRAHKGSTLDNQCFFLHDAIIASLFGAVFQIRSIRPNQF